MAHDVLLQAQEQIDHFGDRGQARRVAVVERVGGEQRLLLDGDLIAEAGVDQHHGVRHVGLFRALDELQLRALHHDGVPQDGQYRRAQRVQEFHELVLDVGAAPGRAVRQTEDLRDLQRATRAK